MSTSTPGTATVLTAVERQMLTRFKARYMVEEAGFTRQEADLLTFLAWRIATGRLNPAG